MTHDIFISYSSNDKNYADAVCNFLEARGIRCWIAPRDIPAGTNWAGAINGAMHNVKAMLLIFTTASNESNQVLNEVNLATDYNKPIIPLRKENSELSSELAYYIKRLHWLDAVDKPTEALLNELYDNIVAVLGLKTSDLHPIAAPIIETKLKTTKKSNKAVIFGIVGFVAVAVIAIILILLLSNKEPSKDTNKQDTTQTTPQVQESPKTIESKQPEQLQEQQKTGEVESTKKVKEKTDKTIKRETEVPQQEKKSTPTEQPKETTEKPKQKPEELIIKKKVSTEKDVNK